MGYWDRVAEAVGGRRTRPTHDVGIVRVSDVVFARPEGHLVALFRERPPLGPLGTGVDVCTVSLRILGPFEIEPKPAGRPAGVWRVEVRGDELMAHVRWRLRKPKPALLAEIARWLVQEAAQRGWTTRLRCERCGALEPDRLVDGALSCAACDPTDHAETPPVDAPVEASVSRPAAIFLAACTAVVLVLTYVPGLDGEVPWLGSLTLAAYVSDLADALVEGGLRGLVGLAVGIGMAVVAHTNGITPALSRLRAWQVGLYLLGVLVLVVPTSARGFFVVLLFFTPILSSAVQTPKRAVQVFRF